MKRIFVIFSLTLVLSAALIAFAITSDNEEVICPTCDHAIADMELAIEMKGEAGSLQFCSQECFDKFKADPTAYMTLDEMNEVGLCLECAKAGGCTEEAHAAATPCEGHEGHEEAVTPAGDVQPAETDGGCTGDCAGCDTKDK